MIQKTILLIIFFLVLGFNFSFSQELNVVYNTEVKPGEILKVKIVNENFQKVSVGFNQELFSAYKLNEFFISFIGVNAGVRSGEYILKIFARTADGVQLSKYFPVLVKSVKFPLQYLTLSKNKFALYTNPEVKKEYKIIGAGITESISEKYFEDKFILPLAGKISTFYGTQRITNGKKGSFHKGIDIAAKAGTPVKAAASGKVVVSATFILHGNTIVINHGLGIATLYIHLQKRLKIKGDFVKQGEVIGLVGSSGVSTGPHLHYGMYANNNSINPLKNFQ